MRFPFSITALICATFFIYGNDSWGAGSIAFDYCDGLIWLKVSTENRAQPLNFLLDSGAGATVLDLQAAQRLGVKLWGREKARRVGGSASAWRTQDFKASVAGIPLSQSPLAVDLSDTSRECSRTIDGLLGEDFFRGRIIEIDFKARRITWLDKAEARNCCAVIPMKVANHAVCVPVSVDGSALKWVRLDTGCDDGLHWVSSTGSGYVRTSVQMGGEQVADVKTALHRSSIFPSESGLLGNGILSRYRVTIDLQNQRVLLARP